MGFFKKLFSKDNRTTILGAVASGLFIASALVNDPKTADKLKTIGGIVGAGGVGAAAADSAPKGAKKDQDEK